VDDIIGRLQNVFRDVFDSEDLVIGLQTTAADVEGWDSINHVNLVLAVEREFKVRLSSSAIARLKNVGDLVTLLGTAARKP
jgi:acyl carrier protein